MAPHGSLLWWSRAAAGRRQSVDVVRGENVTEQQLQADRADWLADRFETEREHLRGVAYRMLGSFSEADDIVQDAWLRLRRADTDDVENFRAG